MAIYVLLRNNVFFIGKDVLRKKQQEIDVRIPDRSVVINGPVVIGQIGQKIEIRRGRGAKKKYRSVSGHNAVNDPVISVPTGRLIVHHRLNGKTSVKKCQSLRIFLSEKDYFR